MVTKMGKLFSGWEYGIERLPDDVLAVILSFLPIKEAVRTSVLSKRWRSLWKASSGCIDFDFDCLPKALKAKYKKNANATSEFETVVNQILRQHQAPSVDKFIVRCIDFPWNSSSTCIGDWIEFAIQKDVRVLEWYLDCETPLVFPVLEKFLSISRVWKPNCINGLSSLTTLKLCCVRIQEDMMKFLLSNCSLLQYLDLTNIHGSTRLKIAACPSLKSLTVCYCGWFQKISISAPNLFSFEYKGDLYHHTQMRDGTKIEYKDVPLLSEVTFSSQGYPFYLPVNRHFEGCNQWKKLVLHLEFQDLPNTSTYSSHRFQSLKHLELVFTSEDSPLLYFARLINEAPILSTFVVQFKYASRERLHSKRLATELDHLRRDARELVKNHPHENLKVVKLMNVSFYRFEFMLVLCLIGMAKSVEKVVVKTGRGLKRRNRFATARERAKQLKAMLPNEVQYVSI